MKLDKWYWSWDIDGGSFISLDEIKENYFMGDDWKYESFADYMESAMAYNNGILHTLEEMEKEYMDKAYNLIRSWKIDCMDDSEIAKMEYWNAFCKDEFDEYMGMVNECVEKMMED